MKHISDEFNQENVEKDMQEYINESNLSPVVLTTEQNELEDSIVDSDENSITEEDDDATVYYDTTEKNFEVSIDDFPRSSNPSNITKTLRSIDLLCPAWIDIYKNKNKYHRLYAFVTPDSSTTILRSSVNFSKFSSKSFDSDVDFSISPRLSSAEKRRRYIGLAMAEMDASQDTKRLDQFFEAYATPIEKSFLQRINTKTSESRMEGLVARALSEYHWKEEYVVMNKNSISFYSSLDGAKNNYSCRVLIEDIIQVERLDEDNSPNLPGYYFLSFSTLAR